ncbi:chromosome segregation ATPase [Poseidonocella pacifica]|uniref:Chromosome partitioning protein ParA n=1 Tax=Poseidonocella pacifica TaxID=871651 RepID=A0A1I0XWT2_9RHOB|nr:AAA family ATPase [Poseidonocella pacifica]SFB04760.1 chromosome segregation ATPase [Poseidonocella pacifica]
MHNHGTTADTRVIAIANQKGGVGKTTTAINLATALSELGKRVLLIDLDPQGNASTGLGRELRDRTYSSYDFIFNRTKLAETISETKYENLDIVASTTDLSSADIELYDRERKLYQLKDSISALRRAELHYDFVFIDCPPSLNLLTLNALVASNSIVVPLQSEFFALEGLSQLMQTITMIRKSSNKSLRIEGILVTMFDARNRISRQVEDDARSHLGSLVFETRIPRSVRLSEAPSFSQSIHDYDRYSKGGQAYRKLAWEILRRYETSQETAHVQ